MSVETFAIKVGDTAPALTVEVSDSPSLLGATANDTTGLHYSQYLFDANLNDNMTQIGFSSGA